MSESEKIRQRYSFRQYREGDEDRILQLRGLTMDVSRDIRWWRWINRDGPDGPAIIWLAEDGQKLIGHHALLPLRIKIGNRECRCALGFDVMTHPDYQRQGVLTEIRGRLYKYAAENDIKFFFGSTEPRIFTVYAKLKSLPVSEPLMLVKILSWGKALKERYRIPVFIGSIMGRIRGCITGREPSLPGDVEVEWISSFDESIDKFWLKASEIKEIMVVRDMKYLNWRYVAKPGGKYVIFIAKRHQEIIGYIVLMLETDTISRGIIVDLLTLPREEIVAGVLVTRAVSYFRGEGAARVSCFMLPDNPYYQTLKKLGFMRRSSRLVFGVRLIESSLSKEFLTDSANWFYTWGDGDTG